MGLGDLPGEGEADAGSSRLRGVEGNEEVLHVREPRPLVLHPHLDLLAVEPPAHADAAAGQQRGVRRVADQVDQQLLDLVGVRLDRHLRPLLDVDGEPRLERGGAADQAGELEGGPPRRRQAGEPRVGRHEADQGSGAVADHLEAVPHVLLPVLRRRLAGQQAGERRGHRVDGGERVVELVAEHADQPLPGLALLLAQGLREIGDHQQPVGAPLFAEGAAPDLPAPRAAGEGDGEDARDLAVEQPGEAQRRGRPAQQPLARLGEQPFPGAVDQPELPMVVEGEHRHVHLVDDAVEEGGGLDRPQPLRAQDLADGVDLVDDLGEGVRLPRRAGAQREVPLAQGREEIGQRLERPGDGGAEVVGEPDPEEERDQGHRPAELQAVRIEPDEKEGEQRPREPGGEREQEDAVLERQGAAAAGAEQAAERDPPGPDRAGGLAEPGVRGHTFRAAGRGRCARVPAPGPSG